MNQNQTKEKKESNQKEFKGLNFRHVTPQLQPIFLFKIIEKEINLDDVFIFTESANEYYYKFVCKYVNDNYKKEYDEYVKNKTKPKNLFLSFLKFI